jgi:glycosyltransferase involved in cell wall biosynthesis
MLSVFIFKSNSRKIENGIITYINELVEALLIHTYIEIFVVDYNSARYKEFSTEKLAPRYLRVNIPSSQQPCLSNRTFEEKYAVAVVNLLSDLIPKNENVIFQLTSIDELFLLSILKKKYAYPILSIVKSSFNQEFFERNQQEPEELDFIKIDKNIELGMSREKDIYQLSDVIISFTEIRTKFLVNHCEVNLNKIYTIPNGIDFNKFKQFSQEERLMLKFDLGFMPNEKVILFYGKTNQFNGIFHLIDSFIEACKYLNNLRLVIMGEGLMTECLEKYQSFYGKITFTGLLSADKIKQFYQITDIGVVQLHHDYCPYTLLEMVANRIPVVLLEGNGHIKLFDETQRILGHPPIFEEDNLYSINEFRKAILSILNDKKFAIDLTENALLKLYNTYTAKEMAIGMNNIYESLCRFMN